ncbi:DUF3365 domain-containing protein [Oryzomonas japonica]|uniref:histidine kinase n=1 Tax=Oryzomonas japonica TaxID=2603858 RepID=A0A7J4ZMW2_9BACT|nr:ATP-binding protein [Oryzomonas japonica]KAB0663634.1 DUF3365 domain-containing protein [Oryzomonas japonica]
MQQGASTGLTPGNRIQRFGAIIAVFWTLLVAYSLYWDHRQHQEDVLLLGKMQSQAFFEKDLLYRRWASRHGGVYVPVTESTQPNPYLSHIPERDITTPSGKRLTLMNPAYMTRQVFEMAQEYTGTGRGHITSLKPIRAENAPDLWEKGVLQTFERGVTEVGEIEHIDGKPYYRYMKSLFADKPCLKCHAPQGYHEGDVRGGLSVSVPLEPIYAMLAKEMRGVYINHAFIWLLGLGGIGFGTRRLGRMTTELYEQTVALEHEIVEREVAQEALQEQTIVLEEEIAERRQIEETVRLSEEKFSKSFDNAPIIMTISTFEEGRFLDVNKKFVELSGFSRQEAVGRASLELGWITPDQRQVLLTEFGEKGRTSGVELRLCSKDKKYITCRYYGELITVDGRQCLLSLAYDMTEQRAMEEQLRQAQKMEAIGQLAGGVAHDFNNVLTVIMGYCNLLQMDPTLDTHQRDEVEQIVASSEKAAQLTRGLLTFSRKEVMDFRLADLNGIVQHVQKFLARVIGEDIQLRTICNRPEITVRVDSAQIEQVLINLATNARDAMQMGGLLNIETNTLDVDDSFITTHGYGTPGRYACIAVSDSGCGMDEQTRKRIFEPFFTTKEQGKGTGLGMAIVYGIVKQHNGFITVYSEPGHGTTFRIYLPLSEGGQGPQEETGEPVVPDGGTETILVAEDEAGVRRLLDDILTQYGYQVILAEDGQEAVEKFMANRGKIHLVLMDIIMPRKSGQEAVAEIWRLQPDIKVCYASGYTADFIRNRGVDDGGIELVMKPVRPQELLWKVREILDR